MKKEGKSCYKRKAASGFQSVAGMLKLLALLSFALISLSAAKRHHPRSAHYHTPTLGGKVGGSFTEHFAKFLKT